MFGLAVEGDGLFLLHVGLDNIDIQVNVDGLSRRKTGVGGHAISLILEVQLLEVFEHSLPILLHPQHVDIAKIENNQQYILGLAEIRTDLHADKDHNNDKDSELHQSDDNLID